MADNALLFFDAIDAARAIWQALLVWLVVFAVTGTALTIGSLALLVWAVRRGWQAVTRRQAGACGPYSPSRGPIDAETPAGPSGGRTRPSWTLTQPIKEN
ncbi:hypothetical protein [Streptomyces sp. LN704]|uniref:hypothetical protein n=1 Tax=Streptomyces sp. LN704 TaxID=3112982 RepID=UPI00371ABE9C